MDDPWGSPWADENLTPKLPPKDCGPQTIQSAISDKTVQQEQITASPWDVDEGFGEWTIGGTDDVPDKEPGPIALKGWDAVEGDLAALNGASHTNISGADTSGWPREDSNRADHTITPQPSSPPEADTSLDLRADSKLEADVDKFDEVSGKDTGDHNDSSVQHLQAEVGEHVSAESTSSLDPASDAETEILSTETHHSPLRDRRPSSENTVLASGLQESVEIMDSPASRPSTSPSDRSHRDGLPTETPRTSFEDTPRRPHLLKKESSKVSDLVQLFNGLTEEKSVEPGMDRAEEIGSVEQEEDLPAAEDDDFGDFEEGQSSVGTTLTSQDDESSLAISKGIIDSVFGTKSQDKVAALDDSAAKTVSSTVKAQSPPQFGVDVSLVDQLFEDVSSVASVAREVADLTREDLEFSSTEQRKTWYRISRSGTMRKYNTGNDENYVRIKWSNSNIRDETLKVVAGWMEEDHIVGGVVLGSGSRLGSLFGWREHKTGPSIVSAAAATELLRSRSRRQRSQDGSMDIGRSSIVTKEASKAKDETPKPPTSTKTADPESRSITSPTFNWSTSKPSSAAEELQSKTSGLLPITFSPSSQAPLSPPVLTKQPRPPSVSNRRVEVVKSDIPEQQNTTPLTAPVMSAAVVDPPNSGSIKKPVEVDDGDDWGEMVSSPAVPVFPKIPLLTPGHRASKSVMSVPSPDMLNRPSGTRHKSSMSISEGLATPGFLESILSSPQVKGRSRNSTVSSAALTPEKDPWANADFSFFETAVPKPQTISPVPSKLPQMAPPQPSAVEESRPRGSQLPSSETERDRIVQNIIQNLPDLSYMLRR
ncbi:MAG: hypothetical protein M1818_002356 [Claussenomyces sp. TS43310]|nr:MAG: hypothetical protein M1818_002356 [Claussenomyces sp. TS43310]